MANAITSAGDLRHRIRVLEITSEIDAEGFAKKTVRKVCACWAAIRNGSYRATEHYSAAVGHLVAVVDFTIRHAVLAKYEIREGMYIQYRGRRHRILRVDEGAHQQDFAVLSASMDAEIDG